MNLQGDGMAKKIKIEIHWGTAMSREDSKPVVYTFDSEKEKDSFMYGVEEANGWMEFVIIDGD